jgi:replication fork protection complex subunit Tof1/Swi1
MERQKVRDTDNVRLFFLSQFLIEYMLILYHREQAERKEKAQNDKGKQKEGEMPPAQVQEILLGYAVIMVEMDSVKWVFSRMRITMEDRVSRLACLGTEDRS